MLKGLNGKVTVHDAFGKVLDLDEFEDDEKSELQNSHSRLTISGSPLGYEEARRVRLRE